MTSAEQEKREAVRLELAKGFKAGDGMAQIAADLRMSDRPVRRSRAIRWCRGAGVGTTQVELVVAVAVHQGSMTKPVWARQRVIR
ncbi:hypothetical protein AB0M28_14230 [Streptomyces sp. NPDC051940]|uniref:hypothetical protein n=1 Tax=Streptomyces sp. NPDC051940 TaxID=3155675 RepID=UPI003428A9FB